MTPAWRIMKSPARFDGRQTRRTKRRSQMGTHAPPTDDLVVGTITTDAGETYAATITGVDAFFDAMNHATRRNSFLRASARRGMRSSIRTRKPQKRVRSVQRSTRSTTSRRAQTSVKSTADPSSSRICLSANAFGLVRGATQRLPLRTALVGNGGAR